MVLKYKNTVYNPVYKVTHRHEGLPDNDFWVNINFTLSNDEIKIKKNILGMSFKELKKWNEMNKRFINNEMTSNEELSFIRRIGEIYYYPSKDLMEKKLYLFDDVQKYYSVYITKDELEKIYWYNKKFIDSIK